MSLTKSNSFSVVGNNLEVPSLNDLLRVLEVAFAKGVKLGDVNEAIESAGLFIVPLDIPEGVDLEKVLIASVEGSEAQVVKEPVALKKTPETLLWEERKAEEAALREARQKVEKPKEVQPKEEEPVDDIPKTAEEEIAAKNSGAKTAEDEIKAKAAEGLEGAPTEENQQEKAPEKAKAPAKKRSPKKAAAKDS